MADGRPARRTILDPHNLLMESDETNNVYVMYLAIEGDEGESRGAAVLGPTDGTKEPGNQ